MRRAGAAQAGARRRCQQQQLQRSTRAVERRKSPRDRAIVVLWSNTGLRIGECAALMSTDSTAVSARKGRVVVREGKGRLGLPRGRAERRRSRHPGRLG